MHINEEDIVMHLLNVESSKLKNNCPLDEWFISVCKKKYSALSADDVCTMLMQDIGIDVAINRAFELLNEDVLCGAYDGQLLVLLLKQESLLQEQSEKLQKVLFLLKKEKEFIAYHYEIIEKIEMLLDSCVCQ